ncbi:hypothetical protein [Stigmatella aurantiaca]|uniref:Lipoprotein n=1 Tax=Stigmatella aurantiaca (strain DW4/3-1) TaxID=378806 RepID=Q08P20_STIAD|nr:hypothetical protein [Stigmatella aurantiaca]ADO71037.1 uncharacterized protein STAUR_3245 [Stigmatella aurantiaca DW4/3-1]EAU62223.1 hypothetical protein STIAU_4594 [Stigmatella aurantiaca DW4/3-1]
MTPILRCVKAPSRSLVLWSMTGLALLASACNPATEEPAPEMGQQSKTLEGCNEFTNPTLTVSQTTITLQCNEPWVEPTVSAVDGCGNPLPVHRYNTGDDDLDGISGDIDPDDFGPGPNTSANGLYHVQYLAWDENFNIAGEIVYVTVENCP